MNVDMRRRTAACSFAIRHVAILFHFAPRICVLCLCTSTSYLDALSPDRGRLQGHDVSGTHSYARQLRASVEDAAQNVLLCHP
jgi:hypothetical protein